MNKTQARKIAETITFPEVEQMFENAKKNITDWTEVSAVNKGMSKGTAWNILSDGLNPRIIKQPLALRNMIWEFGDHLPDSARIEPAKKTREKVSVHHEEPVFNQPAQ